MATIGEMIVKLLADTGNFNASMDEAAAKVTASNDAMAASMAKSMQSFRDFDNITKESVKSAEGLASAQAALQAVQQTGAFTAEELAAKQTLVDAAMAKVAKDADATAFSIAKITNNSRTMYTVSAMATDLMTGQFSRSRREVAALANETGLFGGALRMLLGPAGLVAAAIGAIGAAAIEANKDIEDMERSLVESGNFAGTTTDQMAMMAQRIANGGGDISTASEAIKALAASGRVSHDAMETAAHGVADFAFVTQNKIGEAVKVMVELGRDPVRASAKLNESLNYLTAAQFDQIDSLERQGKHTEAANLAQEVFANAMHGRATQMAGYASSVEKAWQQAWNTVSGHGDVQESEASHTMQTRVAAIKEELDFLAAHGNREKNTLAPGGLSQDPVSQAYIAQLRQEKANLEAELALVNGAAQRMGDAAARVRDHIQQALHPHGGNGRTGDSDEAAFQKAEYAAQQQGHEMSLAEQLSWWQKRLAQDQKGGEGEVQDAQRAMARVVAIQKQVDQQKVASGKRAAEEAKRAAEGVARAESQAYSEITAEIKKAGEAADEAMRQQITVAQQTAGAVMDAAKQGYEGAADAARSALSLHQITAEQEVAIIQRAAEQEYEDQLAALEKELALVQGKPEVVARVNAQIKKLEEQHKTEMQKIDEQAALTYQKTWEDRLKPVSNAFDQTIRGMIQGTQTLRQAINNMLQNVAASFLQHGIDITTQWIADSLARTDATAAAAASQIAITKAAAGQTKAVEAQTGQSQIMSAAATGAAKAYQAVVGIPYVGPILAPIAAGVAFAGIEAFTADLASAAGGWERVPADGMLTELHRDEMVLPKSVADPMRNMARTGGNGGGTIIIQANDAASFQEMARRNRGALAGVMREAYRRGHFG